MRKAPIYLALVVVSLVFLFPFYWVVISSLKSVAGMNLEPPTMYPAEQMTVNLSAKTAERVIKQEGSTWFVLAFSPDRLGNVISPGAYCLQLDKGKPTKLVKWLAAPLPGSQPGGVEISGLPLNTEYRTSAASSEEAPNALPSTVQLTDVPVNLVHGQKVAVVAKMVRQKENGFDELLFTAAYPAAQLGQITIQQNVPHEDIHHVSMHFDNFSKALKGPEASFGAQSSGFLLFMRNSFMIALLAVIGQILSSSLVAYAFARLTFKGRDTLFIVLLATLMVPAQVTLIPLFSIFKSLGWIDSFLPLIVPQFTAGAFNVFLIRQFMLGLPRELDESAELDGASPLRVFRSVVLPNCKPVLIVVGLFTFVAAWQDVMGPLIYLDSPERRTVSLGLEYFRSPYVDNRPLLMAGALLSMIPVALIFLFAQRHILAGIATTGMKN